MIIIYLHLLLAGAAAVEASNATEARPGDRALAEATAAAAIEIDDLLGEYAEGAAAAGDEVSGAFII